jgi:predicted DNA-binding transcriptional regulator AlpA
MQPRLLKMDEVMALTGKSRSAIYAAIRKGTFPAPVKISDRAIAFHKSEITAWMKALARAGPKVKP